MTFAGDIFVQSYSDVPVKDIPFSGGQGCPSDKKLDTRITRHCLQWLEDTHRVIFNQKGENSPSSKDNSLVHDAEHIFNSKFNL